jgi:ribosome biogenesis protein UTP30
MAVDELIDEHVSLQQCQKAVDALHSYETKRQQELQETELIAGKEPNIWLNVTVKKIPPGHRIKPVKVYVVKPQCLVDC